MDALAVAPASLPEWCTFSSVTIDAGSPSNGIEPNASRLAGHAHDPMQKRLNLLMFAEVAWDGTWYSRHHLINGLAERNQVTLVESPVELRALLGEPLSVFRGARL